MSTHTGVDHQTLTMRELASHDLARPFAPENGQPLKFKIGDLVAVRISDEISVVRVIGYYQARDGLYARGKRYLLDVETHWVPYSEDQLVKVTGHSLERMP